MEIYVQNTEEYNKNDTIVVEAYEDVGDVIYVGVIRNVLDNEIETSIPLDRVNDKWQMVSNNSRSNWTKRFENSQYQMYLKATANNNGTISISGV